MTRGLRSVALVAFAAVASSCAGFGSSTASSVKPADLYAIIPTQADVRGLMGDANWWEGAPTFGVQPLAAQTTPPTERYAITQEYKHVGSDEELFARYAMFDKTSSASTYMTQVQTSLGTSPTSPKVGDQVLYYASFGSGGAPYQTRTFVRVGQTVLTLSWFRKDRGVTVQMLARNAHIFADPLRDLGKKKPTARAADPQMLPPAGVSITLLGSTQLPVEAFAVMSLTSLPEEITALLKQAGISKLPFGDYALNNDTSMEVQTVLITFSTETDATDWANTFSPAKPDADGISFDYIPTGGTPAAGVYHFVFSSGRYGAFMICQSSNPGTAATRECESPVHTVAVGWKLALQGLR